MSPVAFARIALGVSVLVFAGAGVAFLIAPAALISRLGAELTAVDATSDVRAFFGGLELGVAAFIAICALSPRRIGTGLLAAVLALGGILAARLVSLVVDGMPTSTIWAAAAVEIVALVLAVSALAWLRRASIREPPVAAA